MQVPNVRRHLFNDYPLSSVLDSQRTNARLAIERMSPAELAALTDQATVDSTLLRFQMPELAFLEGAATVEAEELAVDARNYPAHFLTESASPRPIPGMRLMYSVPYVGSEDLLRARPSVFCPQLPLASYAMQQLHFMYEVPVADVAGTREQFDRDLALAKEWAGWVNDDVRLYNESLFDILINALRVRRAQVNQVGESLASLGLPVRTKTQDVPSPAARTVTRRTAGTRSPATDYDVALSFAGEERQYVENVATALKALGVTVFYDGFETATLWGKNLADHLGAIYGQRARFVVMFISSHYINKAWPTHERQHAQARAVLAKEECLLPVRFDDTPVPGLAGTVSFIDGRRTSESQLADLIVEKLRPR